MSFSFDKITTGTYNFVSVISNVVSVGATIARLSPSGSLSVRLVKTQFIDQFKINSVSKLMNGIFKALQKLLKCFSGITTSV